MIKNLIIESALDGDLNYSISDVPYSTAPWEIVTVGIVQDYYERFDERND